jgi:hypothetical protein
MVRAFLPSSVNVLIEFECCSIATLAQGGQAAFRTSIDMFLKRHRSPPSRRGRLPFFCRDVRE